MFPSIVGVQCKVPDTVEVHPFGSMPIRAWVFGSGSVLGARQMRSYLVSCCHGLSVSGCLVRLAFVGRRSLDECFNARYEDAPSKVDEEGGGSNCGHPDEGRSERTAEDRGPNRDRQ